MKYQQNIAVQLVHIFGPKKGQIDEFIDAPITIGRHPSCSVVFQVDQKGVSRQHAEIIREGNQFKLVDHSTNGTFINGKRVNEAVLKDGDTLEFSEGGPKISFISVVSELSKEELYSPAVAPQRTETRQVDQFASVPPVDQVSERIKPPVAAEAVKPNVVFAPPLEKVVPNSLKRVKAPLIIQYGPQIRSFKELPIVIGRSNTCECPIEHPQILEKHLQISFYESSYRVEDLTGLHQVQVNNKPIEGVTALHSSDEVRLSQQGPVFSFLGDGRFAEVIAEVSEDSSHIADSNSAARSDLMQHSSSGSIWEKIKNKF